MRKLVHYEYTTLGGWRFELLAPAGGGSGMHMNSSSELRQRHGDTED